MVQDIVDSNNANLRKVEINIGDWNMNSSVAGLTQVNVNHGLTVENIRRITVMIRDDAGTIIRPIDSISASLTIQDGGVIAITSTQVQLNAKTGGNFDNASHDATSYNRGWIIIDYVV